MYMLRAHFDMAYCLLNQKLCYMYIGETFCHWGRERGRDRNGRNFSFSSNDVLPTALLGDYLFTLEFHNTHT